MAVQFVLVTFDEDSNRLQPYLDEMKVPFTVVRTRVVEAEKVLGIDNTPSTFYVDCDGIVRYQIVGGESHGDSPQRVAWFIDQLKGQR